MHHPTCRAPAPHHLPAARRRATRLGGLVLAGLLAVALTACGSDENTTAASATSPDTTAAAGAPVATAPSSGGAAPATPTTAGTATAAPTTANPAEQRVEIVYQGGGVVGGPKTYRVSAGKPVVLVVRSDVDEEVHLHGYDNEQRIPAGGAAEIRFEAKIPGVFEIELHDSGKKLGELEVR